MLALLVAGMCFSFTDLGTADDKAKVVSVDADSYEFVSTTSFSVEILNNIDVVGEVAFESVATIDGYIDKVEAEERGSPDLTNHFPNLRNNIAEVRHLAVREHYWLNRLTAEKSLIGITYDYQS